MHMCELNPTRNLYCLQSESLLNDQLLIQMIATLIHPRRNEFRKMRSLEIRHVSCEEKGREFENVISFPLFAGDVCLCIRVIAMETTE